MRASHAVAGFVVGTLCFIAAANAEPYAKTKPFPALDEVRFGIYATNLDGANNIDGDIAINGELLFGRLRRDYADPVWQFLLNPRPHIGFSINPQGEVSQAYIGFSRDFYLTDRVFFESGFGAAIHDGPTDDNNTDSLGCPLLFHESATLGVELTEKLRVMATVEHSSNAGLCSENQGLTNAGVRLGYRW